MRRKGRPHEKLKAGLIKPLLFFCLITILAQIIFLMLEIKDRFTKFSIYILIAAAVTTGMFFFNYGITGIAFTIAILCTFFTADIITIALCVIGIIVSSVPAFYEGFITASGYRVSRLSSR